MCEVRRHHRAPFVPPLRRRRRLSILGPLPTLLAADPARPAVDDGSGSVMPELMSFVDTLGAMDSPHVGLNWLHKAATVERIRAIATGVVPLSHDGLDALMMSNGREHLRALLVAHGVLPGRDRYLAAFERWAEDRVRRVEDPKDRQLIAAYLRWHHGPRLSRLAESGDLTESRYTGARAQTNIAVGLLAWLRRARQQSGDVHPRRRRHLVRHRTHHPSSVSLLLELGRPHPPQRCARTASRPSGRAPGDSRARGLDLLASFLADDDIDLVERVAGCLVLLYALPLTRINRLRATDFESVEGVQTLRIGDDLVPVPSALATLVRALIERPSHVSTAGHPDCDWLFPGRRAGQPIEPDQLAERLNRHGVTRAARTAALDALLATVPAPVLAKLIDRRPWRVAQRTKLLGTDWKNYVALRVQS